MHWDRERRTPNPRFMERTNPHALPSLPPDGAGNSRTQRVLQQQPEARRWCQAGLPRETTTVGLLRIVCSTTQ